MRRTALLLAAAVPACLVAVLLATGLGPVTFSLDSPLQRVALGGGPLDEPGDEELAQDDGPPTPVDTGADDGIPVEVVLSMAFAIVAGALLVGSLLRARPETEEDEEQPADEPETGEEGRLLEAVAEAARRGLDRLDGAAAGPADDAVLACWLELESAGARLGAGRDRTDTPTDFARRLEAAVPALDTAVLADLRSTYSRVRYGSGGAGPDDVRRARAALHQLLAVLPPATRSAPAPPSGARP